jgi:hypothetical protein
MTTIKLRRARYTRRHGDTRPETRERHPLFHAGRGRTRSSRHERGDVLYLRYSDDTNQREPWRATYTVGTPTLASVPSDPTSNSRENNHCEAYLCQQPKSLNGGVSSTPVLYYYYTVAEDAADEPKNATEPGRTQQIVLFYHTTPHAQTHTYT